MSIKVIFEGSCCADCLTTIANGECYDAHGNDIGLEQSQAIARRWPSPQQTVVGDEVTDFSWRDCDACGSRLGGSRHAFTVLSE